MLLHRLGIPFTCQTPGIDENARTDESHGKMVSRLACEKAERVSNENPQAIVIGSDQIAVFDSQIVGKPGTHPAAKEQLLSFSGQSVEFLTAVSVQCSDTGFKEQHIDSTHVRFRHLHADEIERYLRAETPYDCAGSFKAESLGIALFEAISSDDPTALIGLPLIRTAAMLRQAGMRVP